MNMCLISLMELLIGNKYFGAPHLTVICMSYPTNINGAPHL